MGRRRKQYSVEALLAKRVSADGKVEYLIKWENYSSEHNSWEEEANIISRELIDDFEALQSPASDRRRSALCGAKLVYCLAVIVLVVLLFFIIINSVH